MRANIETTLPRDAELAWTELPTSELLMCLQSRVHQVSACIADVREGETISLEAFTLKLQAAHVAGRGVGQS